jgi:hypothetical protein
MKDEGQQTSLLHTITVILQHILNPSWHLCFTYDVHVIFANKHCLNQIYHLLTCHVAVFVRYLWTERGNVIHGQSGYKLKYPHNGNC